MTTTTNSRLGAVLLLLFVGCVGPVQIAPLPYAHPANPDAPAGTIPSAGAALAPPASNAEHEAMGGMGMSHDGMKMEAAKDGTYQCPMHPQVRSDKPGRCPVCGMRLVKKGESAEPQEDHER